MNALTPFPLAVPLLAAAVLMGVSPVVSRRQADVAALATTISVAALCGWLWMQSSDESIVYWAGGWIPRNGIALGIALFVDPFGAVLAALVAVLATASFFFSWQYFETVGVLYHSLMLIFVGAMIGFCLSADLFTLFVFFELMSVAAFGLTAYKVEESPLSGALNFAVTNSVGAFLVLIGISILYGRTGALNLAQVGRALETAPVDILAVMAFATIATGFLVKAAIVPYHFWLADAHAVAPTPVSVLFSGVMIALGIYGVTRVYWTVFSGIFEAREPEIRAVLIGLGAFTAAFGGIMCVVQRHIKRLLAFSSISHMGGLLIGFALLSPAGLAGSAVYLAAHGMVKAALFIGAGTVLNVLRSVDEIELRGKGKGLPLVGIAFLIGGLALAGLPPFGTHTGKGLIEEAAREIGYPWVAIVLFLSSTLTGGAVLRAGGRIFLGWGLSSGFESCTPTERESSETVEKRGRAHRVMILPSLALISLSLIWGLLPNLGERAQTAAFRFQDRSGFAAAVLDGETLPAAKVPGWFRPMPPPSGSPAADFGPPACALLLALFLLFPNVLPSRFHARTEQFASRIVLGLRRLHSGHVGDYVTWLVFGAASFSAVLAFLLS